MASNNSTVLSAIITNNSKLSDLAIQDGQLIFIRDKLTVALDYGSKRMFFNQIIEITTDSERQSMLAPISGLYYFVLDTAVLWTYQNEWVQITMKPQDIICIDSTPEIGAANKLYIDTNKKTISIWDSLSKSYTEISDKTSEITDEDINSLFN